MFFLYDKTGNNQKITYHGEYYRILKKLNFKTQLNNEQFIMSEYFYYKTTSIKKNKIKYLKVHIDNIQLIACEIFPCAIFT